MRLNINILKCTGLFKAGGPQTQRTLGRGLRLISSFIKKNYISLLSFLIPACILEIAFICQLIFPFGKWDILIVDLYHQYAPFISDLQDRIRSFSGILYSWSGGLGASYLPQFAYYLASPLNILTVLFPKAYLTEAILFLTLLKVGLAGACFNYYLKGVHREQNLYTVAFSVLYALSGFVISYFWNIMWMDSLYLLPLVILGLVKMVRDKSGVFYCITLAIALISNFYIAFFICFFSALYFPVCYFQYNHARPVKPLIKTSARFAGFSLLAGGFSAVLLLPTYFALKHTSAVGDVFPKTFTHFFDYFDFITRHFTLASPAIREGMPNLYCGIVILILVPAYFFLSSVSLKEKLLNIGLVFVLIMSFNINMLNFIWHGFHYPNQLPHRFSFVYIFLIASIGYKGLRGLGELTKRQIGAFASAVLILIVLTQKFDDISIKIYSLYASLVIVIMYAAVLTVKKGSNSKLKRPELLFLLAVIFEITLSSIVGILEVNMSEGFTLRDGYSSGVEVAQIRQQVAKLSKENNDFFRMEVLPPKTTNDPNLYNYHGISIFSSTFPEKPVKMMENLGYHSNSINSFKYEGSTILTDSIFGIKYLIHRSPVIDERIYRQIESTDEITVYENPYALPLGFMVPSELEKFGSGWSNPFDGQNNFTGQICGIKDIFAPLEIAHGMHSNMTFSSSGTRYYNFKRTNIDTESTARIKVKVEEDSQVYLYLKTSANVIDNGFIMLGEKRIDFNASRSTIINAGFCKAGATLELNLKFNKSAKESGSFQLYASSLNIPQFEEAIFQIGKTPLEIEGFSNNKIKGRINAENSGIVLITTPFNEGWHVKVDNQEVETKAIDNGLLSFDVSSGEHQIELVFVPKYFYTGLLITALSIIILCVMQLKKRFGKPHRH